MQGCYNSARLQTPCTNSHNLVTTLSQPYKVAARLLQPSYFCMGLYILQVLHKDEAFLARNMKSCIDLARKVLQDNFLARFDQMLQEIYLAVFSCKISARFFISCRKTSFLVQELQDMQDLMQDLPRKMRARLVYFLQDGFY